MPGFVTTPESAIWNARYTAVGSVSGGRGFVSKSYEVPFVFYSSLNARTKTFLVLGGDSSRGERVVGMELHLSNTDGDSFDSLYLITPTRHGGTVTFGFVLDRWVNWLALETGGTATSLTKDGVYRFSITRTSSISWEVDVATSPAREPHPWFSEGTFRISVNRSRPPWSSMQFSFETHSEYGKSEGSIHLSKS